VERDFHAWYPKVRPHGAIAFHDAIYYSEALNAVHKHEVYRFLESSVFPSRYLYQVRFQASVLSGLKTEVRYDSAELAAVAEPQYA
jgi:hypothetical protein